MKMTGAQIILECLKREGVQHIFGYPGGAVIDLYDELSRHPDIKHYLVRHEQAAVHAADGYARASGKVGVALVTSGPGATNTVTGIASAYMDSIPIVVFTGPGAHRAHRQRRLPGGGHCRHHPALHQAQLPGDGRPRPGPHHPRGLLHRPLRAARAGPGGSAQKYPAGQHQAGVSRGSQDAELPAHLPRQPPADETGPGDDPGGQAAGALHRRGGSSPPTPPANSRPWPRPCRSR